MGIRSKVGIGIVTLLLAAAGCGGDDEGSSDTTAGGGDTATTAPAATTTAAEGGGASTTSAPPETSAPAAGGDGDECPAGGGERITVGVTAEAAGLDPAQVTGGAATTGGTQMAALYDTLIRWNPEEATFEPQLAESLTPNEDSSVWTLQLKPDVKFASGNPLDANAVIASIKRLEGSKVSIAAFYPLIVDMTAVDPLTLQITLDAPWGDFPWFFASTGGMIVDATVAAASTPEAFNLNPGLAGAGPYTLERFAPGEEILMKAKEDYWGGPVCIPELRFITIEGEPQALDALKLGEVDVTMLYDPKVLADARAEGYEGVGEVTQVSQILINNREGFPGHDARVRQAIAAAIDLDLINERIYAGNAVVESTMLPSTDPLFTDDMVGPQYDPERAKQLVEEAKADGWDGNIRLQYPNTSEEESVLLQGMLAAVGINLEVNLVTTPDMVAQVTGSGDYDMSGWSLNVLTSSLWARLDTNLRSDSTTNRAGFADPRADEALLELRAATTQEEKSAAMAQLQVVFTETVPGVLIRHNEGVVMWNDNVDGLKVGLQATPLLDDATITQ